MLITSYPVAGQATTKLKQWCARVHSCTADNVTPEAGQLPALLWTYTTAWVGLAELASQLCLMSLLYMVIPFLLLPSLSLGFKRKKRSKSKYCKKQGIQHSFLSNPNTGLSCKTVLKELEFEKSSKDPSKTSGSFLWKYVTQTSFLCKIRKQMLPFV